MGKRGRVSAGEPEKRKEHRVKIKLNNITKVYRTEDGQEVTALRNVNSSIYERELISIIGPSGCGKTTLLNIIAGLLFPSEGEVLLDGHRITGPGGDRGVVFQQDAIFMWRRVVENVEYGLEIQGIRKDKRREIAMRYLKMVHLENFAQLFPKELSGGMKKRVALATVFANNPEVLLMDEPFGALDYQTKSNLQVALLEIWEKESKTTVFVTHDIEEALYLSDRVMVLEKGGVLNTIFQVPFSRPRHMTLRLTQEFTKAKAELWAIFEE
jgi:NitT/TauT family transport system ATP-binding protein